MQMRLLSPFITLTFLLALVAQVQNQAAGSGGSARTTPVGRWQTVEDATGKIDSVVVLWEEKRQTFYGRIERLVNPDPNDTDPRCVRCSGDLKDRNLAGLRITWDLTKKWQPVVWRGDGQSQQRKGIQVLDSSDNGGKRLRVRGFIGFSLLGRTEYWLRDE